MARTAQRPTGARPWRARVAFLGITLVPMLVAAGLFAPEFVEIIRRPDDGGAAAVREIEIPPVELERLPLLLPRDLSGVPTPDQIDLDSLLNRTELSAFPDPRQQLAQLLAFLPDRGDTLVLTGEGADPREIDLDEVVASLPPLPWPQMIGGENEMFLVPTGGNPFETTGLATSRNPDVPVIPEPGTGTLVGPGLAFLLMRRHQERGGSRARSLRPAGS